MKIEGLNVAGLDVVVERKRIKTLRLRVSPPDGAVRISVPLRTPRSAIEAAIHSRRDWIEAHRRRYASQPSALDLEYVSGETHFHQGRAVTLRVESRPGQPTVTLAPGDELLLGCPPHTPYAGRAAALERWQRSEARSEAQRLVAAWAPRLGVEVSAVGIKRMSTRWGTCNPVARRVWLNMELIKRPPECFEYVVVHELAHVLVSDHSRAFWAVVARHLPDWRAAKAELDRWPTWAHGRVP